MCFFNTGLMGFDMIGNMTFKFYDVDNGLVHCAKIINHSICMREDAWKNQSHCCVEKPSWFTWIPDTKHVGCYENNYVIIY